MKVAASIVLSLAILVPIACGGNSKSGGTGGDDDSSETGGNASGGASGTTAGGASGTSPSGGDAGTAPNGGFAGALPTGGDAGATPIGGSAATMGGTGGSGGSGGGGVECETADDCVMFSDCCNCAAVPNGTSIPGCDLVCVTDQCTALQIGRDETTCAFGRCVIDRSCNQSRALCSSPPEPCPGGQVRSVTENGCWGPCMPPTECRDVTDCWTAGRRSALVCRHSSLPRLVVSFPNHRAPREITAIASMPARSLSRTNALRRMTR
jgi:hypothetical protein